MVLSEVLTKPIEIRQTPRSTFLYRKADWEGFKTYMEQVKCDFLASASSKSVEELWSAFKSSINEGLKKFVPVKKIGAKSSLPGVTQEIKRLILKRDYLYQKQKSSNRPNVRKHFVNFRHLVKAKIKQVYDNCLEDVLGWHDSPTAASSSSEASQWRTDGRTDRQTDGRTDGHQILI